DFEVKYNKVKAKQAHLSYGASTSKSSLVKNKGLIAEAYEWDKEDVSSELVEVKVLMTLVDDESGAVSKKSVRNVERFNFSNHDTGRVLPSESQVEVSNSLVNVIDSSVTDYDSADESLVCSTPLPPMWKLAGSPFGTWAVDAQGIAVSKAICTNMWNNQALRWYLETTLHAPLKDTILLNVMV
nr:hypothetical protein [Tanacetum cinerariifolium]